MALSRSACTCAFWKTRAEQDSCYRAFGDLLPHHRAGTSNLREFCASRRFAPHCRLPTLPSQAQFENPSSQRRLFPGYRYNRIDLQAYLYLGGERGDLVFLLACYFGDKETLSLVTGLNQVLLMLGMTFAVKSNRVKTVRHLKFLGADLDARIPLFGSLRDVLIQGVASQRMRAELASSAP
ncbi:MAG: hypothetical protein S4CHLAM2_02130 [Chlamydiales bacterium]|nr:hypothetical protein [Chlamydiales bacterium]